MDEVLECAARLYKRDAGLRAKLGKFRGKISGDEAQLIWQYLRYNPAYRAEFIHTTKVSKLSKSHYRDLQEESSLFWGLAPDCPHPDVEILPEDYTFRSPQVIFSRAFDLPNYESKHLTLRQKILNERFRLLMNLDPFKSRIESSPLLVFVPYGVVVDEAIASIGQQLLQREKELIAALGSEQFRATDNRGLVTNIAFNEYHSKKISAAKASAIHQKLFGLNVSIQGQQIKRAQRRFKKLAALSPWFFFQRSR